MQSSLPPLALALVVVVGLPDTGDTQTLNLSTDLVSRGIAAQNMVPNLPAVDSRPLLQAALDWAVVNRPSRVVLDAGAYYFLTPRQADRYLYGHDLVDMTFDFGGAVFYFREPFRQGLTFFNVTRITIENLVLDFLELPFTQLTVTAVDAPNQTFTYSVQPGFRTPTEFNGVQEVAGPVPVYAVAYRNGRILPGTGRMSVGQPITATSVRINDGGTHAAPSVLATVQPGDTLIVLARTFGAHPFICARCDQPTVRNVTVHASPSVGLVMESPAGALVEDVHVIPPPLSSRLITTGADGIMLQNIRGANRVRNSEIRGAGDDGISVNSPVQVFVDSATSTSLTGQSNWGSRRFPDGTHVSFVEPMSGTIVGAARVVSQQPPVGPPGVFPHHGTITLTFDRPLPPLAHNAGVILADPFDRGEGTIVEHNLVSDSYMARGIYVSGPMGVTVRNNVIRRGPAAAITVDHIHNPRGFSTAPVERIDVIGNLVEDSFRPNQDGPVGSLNALGAMQTLSLVCTPFCNPPAATPNKQVRFIGNMVTGSGRSGIWAANVEGLTLQETPS